ncbi:PREDICTED: adenylate cyclase type 3-like [Ceratosolen solmsi marchali]|uniref:Adenylate cyclase type 3 n=1 Tax=Ceratosolen solmsi marchali TaxID=326594 RepID=A0AAJ6YVI7_9HYME|nr:PREDICTED: adenylate cyclase type 3-like [Ceratosolen solmsi marchali]
MSMRLETSNEESYLNSGRPSNLLKTSFSSTKLERLYRSSSLQQRRGGLQCFLISAVFYDFYTLALPDSELPARGLTAVFLGLNLGLLAWAERGTRARDALWSVVPHVAWQISIAQLLAQLFLKSTEVTPRDSLGWLLLLLYLHFATLPLRLSLCALLAVGTAATYMVSVVGLSKAPVPIEVLILTVTLSLCAAALGASSYSLAEFQQRRAFLETKQSLEVQLIIEEQSAEQERLLLSVLPEHVAVKMRQDLGASLDTQFKKIYMSRHENVSILYADIVGFTAISSTYSASELVKILNELFARFDQLSERYEQLRIKILGDCYYCISGAPQERPDHAVLCIHMGLSMVEAIKYVQQTTNSPVDMRVGIHTGAVLAGVLGQRQWQFDVYSKDVELANKMESSGRAGRVHISNVTLSFLSGEFEVEPAYGEKREEALQKAGITTYFIVKALKPLKPALTKSLASLADVGYSQRAITNVDGQHKEDSEDFRQRLRKELDSRVGGGAELKGQASWLTLAFKDPTLEKAFHSAEEAFSPLSLLGGPLVMICASPVWRLQPWGPFTWGGAGVVTLFGVVLAGATCLGSAVRARWLRRTLALLMIFSMSVFLLLDMANCGIIDDLDLPTNASVSWSPRCPYPSYYSYVGVLALVVISMPVYICYLGKAFLMFVLAGAQCTVNVLFLGSTLDREDLASISPGQNIFHLKYSLSATLLTIAVALVVVARYTEKARRVLYLRGCEVEAQRERAADMKRRNGALIYNILPPHVAAYFLSNTRHHDDLYSQSYAEVGVLFASMPNFADFYSEESINNQGLECLRFLNEVISDFDAILDQEKYKDIIKIKTIGSTYMAASGITESAESANEPQWQHLSRLVEFSLEMKKALSNINEQSFNHFVLKMGINHGPVTAGVIGARKPHYDIWGNTVNVASRMESTGKVGCLQVTDETRKILEPFGYGFEQRGMVFVKGKGQLLTHYLITKDGVHLKLDSDLPVEPTHPIIYQ